MRQHLYGEAGGGHFRVCWYPSEPVDQPPLALPPSFGREWQGFYLFTRSTLTVPKLNSNKPLKTYDAGDMVDAYSLAYEQMADTSVMLGAIANEFKRTKEYLSNVYNIPESCFNDLKRLIAISNTMIQESAEFNQAQEQQFEKEWEANKKAVSL